MKAELKPRINLANRTPLEQVIPLATPLVLFVDPANVCNFRCRFCPTGDRALIEKSGRWQGLLDFDTYRKIIDDLSEFDQKIKVLRLYKEGEPLLNSHFAEMVAYAKQSGRVETIDTTTNGFLLTSERVTPILEAGIDRINISIDGMSSEQFKQFTGTTVDFDRYVKNIEFLYDQKGDCEICVKTVSDILSPADQERFFAVFGDIADRIFIENVAPCWPEFELEQHLAVEISAGIYGQPIGEVQVCPYMFYSMAVNSDGTVSLCFLDWARNLLIGDVRRQSLKEIWQSHEMFSHQLLHLQGRRKDNSTCAQCGQLTHCLPDNVDPYAGEIADRLLASRKE